MGAVGEGDVDLQDITVEFDLAAGFLVSFAQGAVDQRFVITSYSIHYTKLYDLARQKLIDDGLPGASYNFV